MMAFNNYGGYMPQYQNWQQPQMSTLEYRPQQVYPQNQQNMGSFAYCMGIEGAKAFPIAPNQAVFLMDSNDPVAYIKSADMSGKQTLRIFDMVERTEEAKPEEPKIDMSEYAKISDIEDMIAEAVDRAMANYTMTPTKTKRGSASNA